MRNKKKTGGKKEADFDSFENPVAEEPATTSFESETKLSPTALSSTSRKSSDDVATVRNLPTPEVKNLSPPVSVTQLLRHTKPQRLLTHAVSWFYNRKPVLTRQSLLGVDTFMCRERDLLEPTISATTARMMIFWAKA